jgi:hypothetical protein
MSGFCQSEVGELAVTDSLSALRWIRRGLVIEAVLAGLGLVLWNGIFWASREADQLAARFKQSEAQMNQVYDVREALPDETPSVMVQEKGVVRRLKGTIKDREKFQELSEVQNQILSGLDRLRGMVYFMLFILLFVPPLRICGTWWLTALPLGGQNGELWRWGTRLGAVVLGLMLWWTLSRVGVDWRHGVVARSELVNLVTMWTFVGTLRYLVELARVTGDAAYLARSHGFHQTLRWLLIAVGVGGFLMIWIQPGPRIAGPLWILTAAAALVMTGLYIRQLLGMRGHLGELLNSDP